MSPTPRKSRKKTLEDLTIIPANAPAQLPSFRLHITNNKYYYLIEDADTPIIKKSSNPDEVDTSFAARVAGRVLGDTGVGLVVWKDSFYERFPQLRAYNTYREQVVTGTLSTGIEYQLTFKPKLSNSISINAPVYQAGGTYFLDHVLSQSSFLGALNRTFKMDELNIRLLSLMYFILLNETIDFKYYNNFIAQSRVPYPVPQSSDEIDAFLADISCDQRLDFVSNLQLMTQSKTESSELNAIDLELPHSVAQKIALEGYNLMLGNKDEEYELMRDVAKLHLTKPVNLAAYQKHVATYDDRVFILCDNKTGEVSTFFTYNSKEIAFSDILEFIKERNLLLLREKDRNLHLRRTERLQNHLNSKAKALNRDDILGAESSSAHNVPSVFSQASGLEDDNYNVESSDSPNQAKPNTVLTPRNLMRITPNNLPSWIVDTNIGAMEEQSYVDMVANVRSIHIPKVDRDVLLEKHPALQKPHERLSDGYQLTYRELINLEAINALAKKKAKQQEKEAEAATEATALASKLAQLPSYDSKWKSQGSKNTINKDPRLPTLNVKQATKAAKSEKAPSKEASKKEAPKIADSLIDQAPKSAPSAQALDANNVEANNVDAKVESKDLEATALDAKEISDRTSKLKEALKTTPNAFSDFDLSQNISGYLSGGVDASFVSFNDDILSALEPNHDSDKSDHKMTDNDSHNDLPLISFEDNDSSYSANLISNIDSNLNDATKADTVDKSVEEPYKGVDSKSDHNDDKSLEIRSNFDIAAEDEEALRQVEAALANDIKQDDELVLDDEDEDSELSLDDDVNDDLDFKELRKEEEYLYSNDDDCLEDRLHKSDLLEALAVGEREAAKRENELKNVSDDSYHSSLLKMHLERSDNAKVDISDEYQEEPCAAVTVQTTPSFDATTMVGGGIRAVKKAKATSNAINDAESAPFSEDSFNRSKLEYVSDSVETLSKLGFDPNVLAQMTEQERFNEIARIKYRELWPELMRDQAQLGNVSSTPNNTILNTAFAVPNWSNYQDPNPFGDTLASGSPYSLNSEELESASRYGITYTSVGSHKNLRSLSRVRELLEHQVDFCLELDKNSVLKQSLLRRCYKLMLNFENYDPQSNSLRLSVQHKVKVGDMSPNSPRTATGKPLRRILTDLFITVEIDLNVIKSIINDRKTPYYACDLDETTGLYDQMVRLQKSKRGNLVDVQALNIKSKEWNFLNNRLINEVIATDDEENIYNYDETEEEFEDEDDAFLGNSFNPNQDAEANSPEDLSIDVFEDETLTPKELKAKRRYELHHPQLDALGFSVKDYIDLQNILSDDDYNFIRNINKKKKLDDEKRIRVVAIKQKLILTKEFNVRLKTGLRKFWRANEASRVNIREPVVISRQMMESLKGLYTTISKSYALYKDDYEDLKADFDERCAQDSLLKDSLNYGFKLSPYCNLGAPILALADFENYLKRSEMDKLESSIQYILEHGDNTKAPIVRVTLSNKKLSFSAQKNRMLYSEIGRKSLEQLTLARLKRELNIVNPIMRKISSSSYSDDNGYKTKEFLVLLSMGVRFMSETYYQRKDFFATKKAAKRDLTIQGLSQYLNVLQGLTVKRRSDGLYYPKLSFLDKALLDYMDVPLPSVESFTDTNTESSIRIRRDL